MPFWLKAAIVFCASLRRNQKGNVLAIVGAALIPLAAMIGSGVDMSRAYMAKIRLQSACDAAALAGRRVMQDDILSQSVIDEATRFFNYNYSPGLYGTAAFTPSVTRPSAGTIRVSASTTLPTAVMRMFGISTLPLAVTCDASLNFVNTDIMLVLDTTGSMANDINDNYTTAASSQKIFALRNAVMALYDELSPTQAQLESAGMRLRYGVVPYSSTVNVGNLIRQVNPAYLSNNVDYETRLANYSTPTTGGTPTTTVHPPVEETWSAAVKSGDCAKYGRNQRFGGFNPSPTTGGGPSPAPTWTRTYSNNAADGVDWGWAGAPVTSGSKRSCRRRYVQTDTTYSGRYAFTNWVYRTDTIDVTQFNDPANNVTLATGNNGSVGTAGTYNALELAQQATGVSTTTSRWGGCIMERDTTDDITASSGMVIPSDAWDLDIDYIPDSDETRWRAYWPEITHYRSSILALSPAESLVGAAVSNYTGNQMVACPTEARRLTASNRGQLESYMQSLSPNGYTYHDIGMLWGARMISSGGIFADSPTTFNSMPVARHLIFMTDGLLNTSTAVYGAYGVEGMEQRVAGPGGAATLTARHRQRFLMICNALKSRGVSIWVVAFATALDSSLIECASNPGQAFVAADSAQLNERFRTIGTNIGALRLTQ